MAATLIFTIGCTTGICHHVQHPELAASAGPATAANISPCAANNDACIANEQRENSPRVILFGASSSRTATSGDTQQSQGGTNPTQSFGPGVTNDSIHNRTTVLNDSEVAVVHADSKAPPSGKTVFVYKVDGSLQCGGGTKVTAEVMEKNRLEGIRVISRKSQDDGRMHSQVCGAPTGHINVFEIPEGQLPTALARGFRQLQGKR